MLNASPEHETLTASHYKLYLDFKHTKNCVNLSHVCLGTKWQTKCETRVQTSWSDKLLCKPSLKKVNLIYMSVRGPLMSAFNTLEVNKTCFCETL